VAAAVVAAVAVAAVVAAVVVVVVFPHSRTRGSLSHPAQ
jgi:hypothetical protein